MYYDVTFSSYDCHDIHAQLHFSSPCHRSLSVFLEHTNRYFHILECCHSLTNEHRNVLRSLFTVYINMAQKCVISGFRRGVMSSLFWDVYAA